jgi:arylsulfatase A-like enzyme
MSGSSVIDLVKRGALRGLGWGAAVGLVHLAIGVALIIALNVPPMTWFTAKSILMEASVGVVLGALLAPALAAPRGEWLHAGLLAMAWIALERWVAVDPTKLQMWIGPTVGGVVVFGLGSLAWARWPAPVAGAAVGLALVLVAAPDVHYRVGGYAVAPNGQRGTAPAGAPDVLFIVMDTTRAKSVSAYGYERKTTPNFDAFSQEGALYLDADSAATWSLPAHASLFTGHYVSSHQANDETRRLDEKLPTLAGTMASLGWESRCFTANPYISDTFGLTRGFDWTDKAWMTGEGGRQFSFIYRLVDALGFRAEDKGGSQVVQNLRSWMASRPKDGPPAFVFVNFLEAHFPFDQLPERHLHAFTNEPRSVLGSASQTAFGVQFGRQLTDEEIATVGGPIRDMYDGGVRYTDELVGDVIDLWRKRGTLDNTVVVIVGDHGEMVGEHGAFGHVTSLYQPDLHVPLTVRYPSRIPAGTRVTEPVSTVGLFATVLDLAGQRVPADLQAGSLVPRVAEDGTVGVEEPKGPQIAERYEEKMLSSRFAPKTANGKGPLVSPRGRFRTLKDGSWKLAIRYGDDDGYGTGPWLFDLATDPNEEHDLAGSNPEKLAEMQGLLSTLQAQLQLPGLDGSTAPAAAMTAETCEQLKKLGYVADDVDCAQM